MSTRRDALCTIIAGIGVSLAPLPRALRAQEFDVVAQGAFEGASGHETSGSAAIVDQDGRRYVSLGTDFAFDGAPDPKVALGRDGYDPDTLLGPLQADAGAQTYPVPGRVDSDAYNEIWIWCERFDVPLGVARLE